MQQIKHVLKDLMASLTLVTVKTTEINKNRFCFHTIFTSITRMLVIDANCKVAASSSRQVNDLQNKQNER